MISSVSCRMTGKVCKLVAVSLVSLVLTGCVFSNKEVAVSEISPAARMDYFCNELVNPYELTLETQNFLQGELLWSGLNKNPDLVLRRVREYYKLTGDAKYLRIAADFCRYLAVSSSDPEEAICYYLTALHCCCKFQQAFEAARKTEKIGAVSFSAAQIVQNYNIACSGIFSYLKDHGILRNNSVTLRGKEGLLFVLEKPTFHLSVPDEYIRDFSLCSDYSVKHMRMINRCPGFGVPLVGWIGKNRQEGVMRYPDGITIPVNLLIRPITRTDGRLGLSLVFRDTNLKETYSPMGKEDFQLALDFTTPLACFLDTLTQKNLISVMLNSDEEEKNSGLYLIDPLQKDKIPVVFVHGLMSSPGTWIQLINSLKADPIIRKKYQFWFYSYSSGVPVAYSAARLRKLLLQVEKDFCTTPEARAKFDRMVLVGHSMGGLLSRTLVQKEPYFVVENISGMPVQELRKKLNKEDVKLLDEFTCLTPLPFIHRVVFMAVPHRGAKMAQSPIAKLGIWLIRLPPALLNMRKNFERFNAILHKDKQDVSKLNVFYTGIDNLDPDNRFIRALGISPMKEDMTYHCIIGNNGKAGVPGGSDGVVPYSSSHLDNAASELIVDSNHSVHRKPETSLELQRILLLHLQEKKP